MVHFFNLVVITDFENQPRFPLILANGDIATVSGKSIKIWDPNLSNLTAKLKNVAKDNDQLFFSRMILLQDDELLTGDNFGTIKKWNPKNKTVENILEFKNTPIDNLFLLKNNNLIIFFGNNLTIVNLTDRTISKRLTFKNQTIKLLKILLNDLLVIKSYQSLRIYNINLERVVCVLPEKKVAALGSLNNGTLISGAYELIKFWDVTNGALLGQIRQSNMFNANAFMSLEDEYLAVACGDRSIKIWNLRDKTLRMVLRGHTEELTSLNLFPNGNLLSTSNDHTIRIWKNPLNFLLNSKIDNKKY